MGEKTDVRNAFYTSHVDTHLHTCTQMYTHVTANRNIYCIDVAQSDEQTGEKMECATSKRQQQPQHRNNKNNRFEKASTLPMP